MDRELCGAYCREGESALSCNCSLILPNILKILLAEKVYLTYSIVKICVKIHDRFSECCVLNVIKIDRLTDVKGDCKNASQETNASKIYIVAIRFVENLKSLPNSAGILTRQDTRMWVISYMINITFFPTQRFIRRDAH